MPIPGACCKLSQGTEEGAQCFPVLSPAHNAKGMQRSAFSLEPSGVEPVFYQHDISLCYTPTSECGLAKYTITAMALAFRRAQTVGW